MEIPPYLGENGFGELLSVDYLYGHLLARDAVDTQLHQPWGHTDRQSFRMREAAFDDHKSWWKPEESAS